MSEFSRAFLAVLGLSLPPSLALAQPQEPSVTAASDGSASVPAAAPAESTEPPRAPGRVIDARAAVRLALHNSPTLSVARIEHEKAKWGVTAEEGRYQFVFEADAGYTQATNPRLQPGDVLFSNTSRSAIVGAGLNRTFATGTTAEFRLQGERFENSFSGGFQNPLLNQASGFGSTMRLTLTQPILRGAGSSVGEVELRAARTSRVYAEKSERRVASQLVRDVLIAYYELWYATESIEIEQKALELARKQEAEALDRVQRGALAPADALTFSSRVAELEEAVVTAETNERTRALELLRLTGSQGKEGGSEVWMAEAGPDDLETPNRAELEAALRDDSVELAELEAQVQTARVRAEVAGDALRPKLDAEGYIESRGLGEAPDSAVARMGEFGWVTGHIGVTFELPLDQSRKEAERAAAQLAVSSAQASLRVARDRIASDASTGVMSADAARKRLKLAQRTRELAEKTFEAEQGRFRLGLAIPMQVQEADDTVRRARLREARARVDLANEQTNLQHLTGQLLDQFGS